MSKTQSNRGLLASIAGMAGKSLILKGGALASFPWKRVWISPSAKLRLGAGARLVLERGAMLGDRCLVMMGADALFSLGRGSMVGRLGEISLPEGATLSIGHGVYIGSGVNLRARGGVVIGDRVQMGPYVSIMAGQYRFEDRSRPLKEQGFEDGPVEIGEDAWIGAGAIILPGRRVGAGAVVGAGSVVTKDVPDFAVVGGNPARVIRER